MEDFSISDDDDFDGDFDFGAAKHRFSGQPDFKSKGKTAKPASDDPYNFDLGDDPFQKPKGKQGKGKQKGVGKHKKQDVKIVAKPVVAAGSGSALSRADGMLAKYSNPANFVKAAPVKVSSELSSSSEGGMDHMDDIMVSDDSLSPSKPVTKSGGDLIPPPLQPPVNPTLAQVVTQPKPAIQSALFIPSSAAFATKRPASFHESSMQELDSVLEEDIPDEVASDISGLSNPSPPPRVIAAVSKPVEQPLYAVGDRVEAAYGRGEEWYTGVIAEVHHDGTFAVKYDDGDEDNGLTAQYIRRRTHATPPATLSSSAPVKAVSGGTAGLSVLPSVSSVASEYSEDGFEKSTMSAAVKTVAPSFAVGDHVECRYRGSTSWFSGKVTGRAGNGTYSVMYDDGDKEDGVSEAMMRRATAQPPVLAKLVAAATITAKAPYAVGDRVEAAYGRGEEWYTGVIAEVHHDGTFAVKYDDGDEDNGLTAQYIRKRAVAAPTLSSAAVGPAVPLPSARSDYSEDGFEKSTASASTKPPRSLKSELSPRFQPAFVSPGIAGMGKSPSSRVPPVPAATVAPQITPTVANTSVVSEAYTEDFDNGTVVGEEPKKMVMQPPPHAPPQVHHSTPAEQPQHHDRVITAVASRFKSVGTQTVQPDVCVSCGSRPGTVPQPPSYGYPYYTFPAQPGMFPVSTMPTVGTASAIMFQRMLAVMMDSLQRPPQHQPQILYPPQLQPPPGGEYGDPRTHTTAGKRSSSSHGPRRHYSWRDVPIASSRHSRDVSPQSMQSRRSEGGSPPPIVGTSLYSRDSCRDAWPDVDASGQSPHVSGAYQESRASSPGIPPAPITGELKRLLTQPRTGGDEPFQSARIPSLLSPAQAIASSASTLKLNLLNRSSDRHGDLTDAVAANNSTTKTLYAQINQLRSRIRESRSVLETRQDRGEQRKARPSVPKPRMMEDVLPYSAKIDTALLLSKRNV